MGKEKKYYDKEVKDESERHKETNTANIQYGSYPKDNSEYEGKSYYGKE